MFKARIANLALTMANQLSANHGSRFRRYGAARVHLSVGVWRSPMVSGYMSIGFHCEVNFAIHVSVSMRILNHWL